MLPQKRSVFAVVSGSFDNKQRQREALQARVAGKVTGIA